MSSVTEKIKTTLGLKVVGHVDLNAIPTSSRPVKHPEESKKERRQQAVDEHNQREHEHNNEIIVADLNTKRADVEEKIKSVEASIAAIEKRMDDGEEEICKLAAERKRTNLRIEYLTKKRIVRQKYSDFSLSNDVRQHELRFNGIRPIKMDVVHFHVAKTNTNEEMDGVALVRDENHYYIAIDMYNQPENQDNATTIMDENPDGTFEGIWPKNVVLKAAQKFEEKYMRALADKYADDLDKAEKVISAIDGDEEKEIQLLEAEVIDLNEKLSVYDKDNDELNKARITLREHTAILDRIDKDLKKYSVSTAMRNAKTQLPVIMDASDSEDEEQECSYEYETMDGLELDTDTEKQYPHLPFLRGKRNMTTMNWPTIEDTYEPWLRYRLMSNIARLVMKVKYSHALTYVMTEDYYDELVKRGKSCYKGMTVQDVVSEGEVVSGVLVFPSQGFEDTLIYNIDCRHQMSIIMAYIREGRMMFYESYSVQEILGKPRTDSYMCSTLRETGTDVNRLFGYIRNMIISFLAMERDMERTVNFLIEEGKGSATELEISEKDAVDTTDDKDVVIRDANWYTDITVNREIPVRGYISHRWCGSGKDKFIKEVWVRPHVKQGYHRSATVSRNS